MPAADIDPPRNSPAEQFIRQRRKRRILKWLGTCTCILILAAAAVTIRWTLTWTLETCGVGLWDGALGVFVPSEHLRGAQIRPAAGVAARWWIYGTWYRQRPYGIQGQVLTIPLWILFAAIAVPTVWLWRRDWAAAPPGCCRICHFDLTGNTTGVCPECGQPAVRPI